MADLKSINGLASANIKSINGLAIASVKSYNGLLIPASGWDISNISLIRNNTFGLVSNNYNYGMFFKSDGTKLYVNNNYSNKTYQFSLSTAWNVSTASYDNVSNDAWGNTSLFFNSDGTKMYINRNASSNIYIRSYSLSTAWDLSTASLISSQILNEFTNKYSHGIFFKPDGTKMYITCSDYGNDNKVYQYSLSTAWDVSTASYDSKSFSYSSQTTNECYIWLKTDGTKMYIINSNTIYQYSLSTAWDVSTASYDNVSGSINSYSGVYIKSDGTAIYGLNTSNKNIYQYSF